jgi:16S rRNA G1207 methylase RsmC
VPFEPTPHHVVVEMLKLAHVGAKDLVYDLGCGDGRIVIAAAKQAGARSVCVDIDPRRIRESRANAQRAGVEGRITFLTRNFFETDVGDATVVTLFLWPEVKPQAVSEAVARAQARHAGRFLRPQHGVLEAPGDGKRGSQHGPRKVFLWIMPAEPAAVRSCHN